MAETWLYVLLGFIGGFIFSILLLIALIKKIISIGKREDNNG